MGTDEYAKLCSLIGTENFVCINAGLGTLDQARHWIEYCNYPKGTYYSDLRRKYGNEQPFNVKYWSLGNEIDGPWQLGQKNAEDYCKFALEAAKAMRLVDRNVKFIADGASNYRTNNDWIAWNDYVLQHMVGSIDYLSVHRYVREALAGDTTFSGTMSLAWTWIKRSTPSKPRSQRRRRNPTPGGRCISPLTNGRPVAPR